MSSQERDFPREPSRGFPQFTRYEVREVLGEGATSLVYSAWDRELHRPVAIKLLRESAGLSDLARQRFRREAQAAAGMAHPNVVTLYDAGEQDGRPYLVLELVEGRSFSETLQKNPGFRREHVELLAKAARGVGAVHAKGIVHRDLKPANILVTASGEPKVGDFGLVHLEGTTMELTRSGTTLGTPFYMAPEQVEALPGQITPRTDVYGLGAILYELLTGRAPHVGESLVEIYKKILQDDPVRIRTLVAESPPDLEAVALKALSKDPAARYANGDAFADELDRYLAGQPVQAKPPSFADEVRKTWVRNRPVFLAAGVGLAVALVVAALLLPRWMEEKKARELAEKKGRESGKIDWQARDKSFREVLSLWSDVLIARQGWYQAQKDPRQTRAQIEEKVGALNTFIASHSDQPHGYYIRARAHLYLDELGHAKADLQKVTALEPGFGPAYALLGRVYLEEMWEAALRNREMKATNLDDSAAMLKLATEAFAKVPASASGQWGLERIDEDVTAAPMARALLIAFSEKNLPKAKESLLEIHRRSPSEEYALLLGQLSPTDEGIQWQTEALRIRPHFFKAYFNRGTLKDDKGDTAGAEADFTEALKINPRHGTTFYNRSLTRLRLGNLAGALEDVEEALRLKPEFPNAHHQRAVILMRKNDLAGALKELQEALRLQPNQFTALATRASLKSEKGDQPGAIQDATRALELAPRYAYALLVRSMARQRAGDLPGSLDDVNAGLKITPEDAVAYIHRGGLRMLRLEYPQAIADFTEAIRLKPGHAEAHNNRAAARLITGENQGAYADAVRALELDRSHVLAYANRALAEIRLGRNEAAIGTATQGLKLDRENGTLYGYRALAKAFLGEMEDALLDVNAAIERVPDNPQFRANRAEMRNRLGDSRGALADATEAIRLAPDFADAYTIRASIRLSMGDLKGGIEDATAALKLNPKDTLSYSNRAGARVHQRDYAGAVEDATKALEYQPGLVPPYQHRAMALLKQEKWKAALDDANAGLKLAPTNPNLLLVRALSAEKLAGPDPAAALINLQPVRRDLEQSLEAGGALWMQRAEAEAALLRIRARLGDPPKK